MAEVFARYGIGIILCVCFASPIHVGGLKTADPESSSVKKFWADKAKEVKGLMPSWKGFMFKADSEGEPGPKTYGRNQSAGANGIARAVDPLNGTVIWRAFEYGGKGDRAMDATDTFREYDGEFDHNVLVQIKNGPLDFQVREPVSSLFGVLTKTRMVLEVQVTQEYTGQVCGSGKYENFSNVLNNMQRSTDYPTSIPIQLTCLLRVFSSFLEHTLMPPWAAVGVLFELYHR